MLHGHLLLFFFTKLVKLFMSFFNRYTTLLSVPNRGRRGGGGTPYLGYMSTSVAFLCVLYKKKTNVLFKSSSFIQRFGLRSFPVFGSHGKGIFGGEVLIDLLWLLVF